MSASLLFIVYVRVMAMILVMFTRKVSTRKVREPTRSENTRHLYVCEIR